MKAVQHFSCLFEYLYVEFDALLNADLTQLNFTLKMDLYIKGIRMCEQLFSAEQVHMEVGSIIEDFFQLAQSLQSVL
jgi:hypothetical protein